MSHNKTETRPAVNIESGRAPWSDIGVLAPCAVAMAALYAFRKLKLLLWKNWILTKRNKVTSIWTLSLPVILFGLLAVLRAVMVPTQVPNKPYASVSIRSKP